MRRPEHGLGYGSRDVSVALRCLLYDMNVATTVFDHHRCLVLPGQTSQDKKLQYLGPALVFFSCGIFELRTDKYLSETADETARALLRSTSRRKMDRETIIVTVLEFKSKSIKDRYCCVSKQCTVQYSTEQNQAL